ncbi:FKBP-type peptidyl-prolyl cis-trans isomerase [Billgrantia desiderata]|uniref:Peptidyl-prolyl cis-trans isomerase n=1 Tax=Billgrantia desiderata TaxID=52021 RepID=A0AAW4YW84_9GAMM|nr:FKBP-type peptidyl-prolyl cis-trans isomerase [Halomonas desiderata]MCE8029724.1 FKBP-type peptidyl-prolyl cis-trans isomerase [Halomonas desiderata]MCE8042538.1 FKBP-type peptidyl-prolyl cis-trans isomerase [Halomonas desiderata]MCE8047113.1 FKBP-type peptidyl-prolyl cis-trans isomerase [Halomonas desiderata]MCE8053124.1 FKBP-type peptidyl-prolyl cis-trans isomerase [Halomonas desiderata]NIC36852.1 FKBP-type peptidyl-prolyl cis-trans isomerase [Halomonas desiderata]
MKTLLTSASLAALVAAAPFALAAPETEDERLSYSLGIAYGQSIAQEYPELDVDAFSAAIRDIIEGNDPAMSAEEMAETLSQFQQDALAARQAEAEQLAELNLAEGQAFLAENGEREEVTTTDSGLQYEVLESGDGESPGPSSHVEVHYEGTLVDGTVFDSSLERGQPLSFRVDQVIEGWQEALQLMSVGDTWMLFIPPELGYGAQGQGPIGPNETLIFRVELLDVME